MTASRVVAEGLAFPEGPAFEPDGTLWWVEIDGSVLGCRRNDGSIDRRVIGGKPNGLAFDKAGELWICDQGANAVRRHDPLTGETATIVSAIDGKPLGKPNDLAFDAMGNLVFTCPNDARQEPNGYICCLGTDGGLHRIANGLFFPNGLAFTPDGAHLVVAETYRHRLWKGVWDPFKRVWVDPQPWIEVGGPIGPDGMAFANDGLLYVAIFGQGLVRLFDHNGGPKGTIATPGQRPTNVAFDPSGQQGLVVTEAEHGQLLSYPSIRSLPVLFPRSS
ncbi:hypothetical protein BB934_38050 (plasmid) [Microvirga ossetica]|uniref:SMP-30/Gluconolactonase/LRE-like region domain-containing protein n=1 Tax=Microvirga ossetica TaxID=1882682 RepID=A0A1B2EVS8_9HYPH|nr:SMP-30/gluconolactonase/LRE family protein [Microvirga ossetica]ANY84064.1 hypothetical protein BB934_38050 [Microvirga ossetica]